MQIWAESGKSALPICNYSQILYQFLTFTQNLKRSPAILFYVQIFNIPLHFRRLPYYALPAKCPSYFHCRIVHQTTNCSTNCVIEDV